MASHGLPWRAGDDREGGGGPGGLEKHRQKESCNDCHSRLDPWGIPFERYNATGRYQPNVPKAGVRVSGFRKQTHSDMVGYRAYLDSINTESVDASAKLPNGETVHNLSDLKVHLLKKRKLDIAENILRRLMGYALGRELDWRDRFEVKRLMEKSQQFEFRLRDMIILICQSPTLQQNN